MLPWVLYNCWAAFYKWWAYSHFSSYQVNGVMVLCHWWQHSLDHEKPRENAGLLKNVVETWQQARLRQKARSCKGEATFLPRFPSACEKPMKTCSKAQVLWENNGPASHKDFGGDCKGGSSEFTEAKQIFNMMLSLSLTSQTWLFRFFRAKFTSSGIWPPPEETC